VAVFVIMTRRARSRAPGALDDATIPVVVYLDQATPAPHVEQAIEDLLAKFGFEILHRDPPVVRSWFRRMTAVFTHAGGPDVGARLLRELDRGVELRAVDEVQARVDAAQGDAVAKLLTALADTDTALIQIGSALLIKVDGVPVVRNLTQTELACLQRNPHLTQNPADCLRALQAMLDRTDTDRQARNDRTAPALTGRTDMYKRGFQANLMGPASAIAVILVLVGLGLALLLRRLGGRNAAASQLEGA
jgi:hypothetical protein